MVVSQACVLCSEQASVNNSLGKTKRVAAFDPEKLAVPKRKKVRTVLSHFSRRARKLNFKKSKRTDELYQKLNKGKDLHCLGFL